MAYTDLQHYWSSMVASMMPPDRRVSSPTTLVYNRRRHPSEEKADRNTMVTIVCVRV
jgi:hypothetical protein